MTRSGPAGPQGTFLFRAVSLATRLQLGSLVRRPGTSRWAVMAFVFLAGATALAIITAAALVTGLPLLFPPLGPSAFILFLTPMSDAASPRNVVLSHALALGAGLGAYWTADSQIAAVIIAFGLSCTVMILLRCNHAPAAATALLAAMGFFESPLQIAGLLCAVLLLVGEAFLFNRILGGLPYPLWRADPSVSREYGALAGIPAESRGHWQELSHRLIRRHRT